MLQTLSKVASRLRRDTVKVREHGLFMGVETLENRQLMAATNFIIDTNLSSIAVAVSYSAATPIGNINGSFAQQSAGSLSAKYTGTIKTDLTANSIKFVTGSTIDATAKPGPFSPGNTGADYAGTASIFFSQADVAVRNLKLGAVSNALALAGNAFVANSINVQVPAGVIDYASSFGSGTESLVGSTATNNGAGNGSLVTSGNVKTLTLPVNAVYIASFGGVSGILTFTGTIVAKATTTPPPATGSIAGSVFNDVNGNGTRQAATEPLLANETVFLDTNNDGLLNNSEKNVKTSATGAYKFNNLPAATYNVRHITKAGFIDTAPVKGVHKVTLASAQVVTGKAFGTGVSRLGGIVFKDLNGNGVKDTADKGMEGVRVYLDANKNGKFDTGERSMQTDILGRYGFVGLTNASYRVREVVPVGHTLIKPASGFFDVTLTGIAKVLGNNFFNRP